MGWSTVGGAAGRSVVRVSCAVLGAAVLALIALLAANPGGRAEAEAYSAYRDSDKPAISTALASDADSAAFQERFDLSDEELGRVLAAVREGDRSLAEEYEQSERLIGEDADLSEAEAKRRVEASDYTERTREVIAGTKAEVLGVVGAGSEEDLASWVDARFSQDAQELAEEIPDDAVVSDAVSSRASSKASGKGHTCRVWTTYYRGYTRYEVAVPHKSVKFAGGKRVRIRTGKGTVKWAPVKEVGPWNLRDNYWQPPKVRDRWSSLKRCVPEASAAYFWNFHRGRDEFGRKVTNPAGFDMTIAVARRLDIDRQLRRNGKLRVYVHFPWAR